MSPALPFPFRSRVHLLAGIAAGFLAPLLLLGLVVTASIHRTQSAEANRRLASAGALAAQVVHEHLEAISRYLERAATRPDLAPALERNDASVLARELSAIVAGNPELDRVFIADPRGVLLADAPHLEGVIGERFAHRDWYQGASSTQRPYVSGIYRRAAEPRVFTVAFAVPVRTERGTAGYLVGQHTIQTLAARLASIPPSSSATFLLADREGVIAALGPDGAPPRLADMPRDGAVHEAPDPLSGEPSALAIARVEPGGFAVIAREPMSAFLQPLRSHQRLVAVLCLLAFAMALAIAFPATDRLRREHANVLALERARDALTSMVVHDLRNPLTVSLTLLDALAEDLPADSLARKEALDAREASRRLLQMINTLLDITRMEDGRMPFERRRIDVTRFVEAKVGEYLGTATARGISLRVERPAGAVEDEIDPEIVGRVLENLVVNALKHTPHGGEVVVGVDGGEKLRIDVRDTGEGIASESLDQLFDKYARAKGQSLGTGYDTGLGLVFCRMAVELHGGRITAESAGPGRGSRFAMEFPRVRRRRAAA